MSSGKAVLFYADWCGHCQAMKPEWTKVKAYVKKHKLPVVLVEIEHSDMQDGSSVLRDADVKRVMEEPIQGYPTLRLYNRRTDSVVEFNNMRTAKNMVTFFEQGLGIAKPKPKPKPKSAEKQPAKKKKKATPPAKKKPLATQRGGFLRGQLLIQREQL